MIDSPAHKGNLTRYGPNHLSYAGSMWIRLDVLDPRTREQVQSEINAVEFQQELRRYADQLADHCVAEEGEAGRSVAERALAASFEAMPDSVQDWDVPMPLSERRKMTQALRRKIMERDEYRCKHCGDHRQLQVDHVIAVCNGGLTEEANLQTLCGPCNRRKGTT